ncbi:MAG: acyltransferase [Bacteroidales bacterium]|nr:acyltransferase [Candidatus Liminaster caballi]
MSGSKPMRFYQMDLVRYYLAVSVIIAHFNVVFGRDIPWPTDSGTAVGVFFGLSGFLVYASYERSRSLSRYVASRAWRILPAYWFVVGACALLLSLLSTCDVAAYFTSSAFWRYLAANLTFLNFLQPDLPGVFADHAVTAVNGSLWTLKVEWMLYLSLPLFVWLLRRFRIRFLWGILGLFAFSLIYNYSMIRISSATGSDLFYRLSYQFAGQFVYFYLGVLCYRYKEHLMAHKLVYFCFGATLLNLHVACMSAMPDGIVAQLSGSLVYPIATVTMFLVLSVSTFISPKVSVVGNCSYEMYLFHFPILQSLACWPMFHTLPQWAMLGISLSLTFLLSFLVNRAIIGIRFFVHHD